MGKITDDNNYELIEQIMNHMRFVWKKDELGYKYKVGLYGWIHFDPFLRDADATMLMVKAQINLVWDNGMCYASKNQFSRMGTDWRRSVAVVYINYMNHQKDLEERDVRTEVHLQTKD